jgi:acyl-coenzyme A synthetase/AMP-(fatty) acid ligase
MGRIFPQTVLDLLAATGDRPCFEHRRRTVSGPHKQELIARAGGTLRARGLHPGSGVALVPGVSPEGFAAMFAAFTLGLRVSLVRPGLTAAQFGHLVTAAGAEALLVDPAAAPDELLAGAPGVPRYAVRDLFGGTAIELVAGGEPDGIGQITYTSGSTGRPKGVATSYRALSEHWPWNPPRWTPVITELTAGLDRYLTFGTLASPVVLDYAVAAMFRGGVAVVPDEVPEPLFPGVIERYRITGSIMSVPRLYQMLDHLRDHRYDLSTLRMLMVSGSPLNPRRFAAAIERLGPVIFHGYGQTETGTLTMLAPSEVARGGPRLLSSVGRPLDGVDVEIRDGEVYVRAPYQGSCYWRDPAETADVYVDGWVRTRDLGYLDPAGYLHLTGRTRDVIIVNALIYYAGPIEEVLSRHPEVDQAYVTGAPDESTGEAIHAFVVPVPGRGPDPAVLDKLVRAELGDGSAPATITVIPEVVTGPSGKPDKRATLARYLP